MPEISHDALKAMVAEHGVRGTARMLKMDDKQMEAFRKRVQRAGWCQEPDMKPLVDQRSREASFRPIVSTLSPMEAKIGQMKEDVIRGRSASLEAGRIALEELVTQGRDDAKKLLVPETAQMYHTYAKGHALSGGYGSADNVGRVNIHVASGDNSSNLPATIEAQWTEGE